MPSTVHLKSFLSNLLQNEMILNNYGIALRDAGKKKKANEIFKRAENLGRFNQVKRPGFDG